MESPKQESFFACNGFYGKPTLEDCMEFAERLKRGEIFDPTANIPGRKPVKETPPKMPKCIPVLTFNLSAHPDTLDKVKGFAGRFSGGNGMAIFDSIGSGISTEFAQNHKDAFVFQADGVLGLESIWISPFDDSFKESLAELVELVRNHEGPLTLA